MTLFGLLPSTPYLLAYALPLLFISLPLAFAGAFLTLDRTRVFTPRKDAAHVSNSNGTLRRRRLLLMMEGGIGGLAGGYLFGLLLSTLLALLIPALTTYPSLSHKSFVAVWIFSVIPATFLGGRWRYAALALTGITGGATLALAVSVIIHPSLLVRVVLVSVFTPLLAILTILPISATRHVCLRLAAASSGCFGLILAVALLVHQQPWAEIDDRLWTANGEGWGTPAEKGLSAGYCLLLVLGCASDWLLHRRFGENPDQRWDAYLANYAAHLPNHDERAGVFEPLASPFARLLRKGPPNAEAPPLNADDATYVKTDKELGLQDPPTYGHSVKLQRPGRASLAKTSMSSFSPDERTGPFAYDTRPGFLKKKSTRRVPAPAKRREGVKFRPLSAVDHLSSDSDSDGDFSPRRPWAGGSDSKASLSAASGTTLIDELDVEKERAALSKRKAGALDVPDYSDYESDGASARRPTSRGEPGWSPEFIRQASQSKSQRGSLGSRGLTSTAASTMARSDAVPSTPGAPRSVPATPSLIRAVDRLAAAQEAAYGPGIGMGSGYGFPVTVAGADGEVLMPNGAEDGGERWASFWRDVKEKAGRPAPAPRGAS